MITRFETHYKDVVVPQLMERFGYKNPMQVPRLAKITLNMGVGEAAANKKVLDHALDDMTKIAGQKPVSTKARNSVATFKIRDGWPIGAKVTRRNLIIQAAAVFTVRRLMLSRHLVFSRRVVSAWFSRRRISSFWPAVA